MNSHTRLEYLMSNRLDLKLSHILHLIFVKFGYNVKKEFLKLSRLLSNNFGE